MQPLILNISVSFMNGVANAIDKIIPRKIIL